MPKKPAYSQTQVSVARTRLAILELMEDYGATKVAFIQSVNGFEISFQVVGELPVKLFFNRNLILTRLLEVHTQTEPEVIAPRAEKTAWRQAYHYLKATLESIDLGLFSMHEGFLSGFAGPDGRTLGETIASRLGEWSKKGKFLPAAREDEVIDVEYSAK